MSNITAAAEPAPGPIAATLSAGWLESHAAGLLETFQAIRDLAVEIHRDPSGRLASLKAIEALARCGSNEAGRLHEGAGAFCSFLTNAGGSEASS